MVLVTNILVLQHILSKVYFFYLHLVCLWIILVEIYVESLIFCSNSQAELFSYFYFYFYLFFNYNVIAMHLNFEINMCL